MKNSGTSCAVIRAAKALGMAAAAETVITGLEPAPERNTKTTWKEFLS